MVETLTERNLDLEEKVRELREAVTDLVRRHQTENIDLRTGVCQYYDVNILKTNKNIQMV